MEKQNETEGKLSELPACAAEFIKLVINKMRYRKKVREDVQAELAVHFEDELKGIKTEADREEKAKQLVGGFGDVKLLAVLLRRAKKRCRPLWRTAVVRTFQTIGVLVVCFVIYVVWFLTGKPVITTNYVAELNNMVRPIPDESFNAAPLYIKASELYQKRYDDMVELLADLRARRQLTLEQQELLKNDIINLLREKREEVTVEQKEHIKGWLTNNKDVFDLVIAGAQKPHYWSKYVEDGGTEDMMKELMPYFSGFRRLVFALRWRAWLNAEQGRFKDALVDMKSCYRLGQHLRGDKTLIEQLVGIAIEALAVQAIRDIIIEYRIDSTTLAVFQQDFEQMIAGEDFVISLKAEKFFTYDLIQRTFTGGFGDGHIIPRQIKRLYPEVQIIGSPGARIRTPSGRRQRESLLPEFLLDIKDFARSATNWAYILFLHPDKQQTFESTQELYNYYDALAVKTPAQIRAEGIDAQKETIQIVKGNILLEGSPPAFSRITAQSYRNKAAVEAVLTIIAILRYNQETGDYPDNLAKLTEAGFLKALPIDPYSDQPLVYKKTDNNFVLYGVGENFKDDGGMIAKVNGRPRSWGTKDEGDWVFWSVPKSQLKQ